MACSRSCDMYPYQCRKDFECSRSCFVGEGLLQVTNALGWYHEYFCQTLCRCWQYFFIYVRAIGDDVRNRPRREAGNSCINSQPQQRLVRDRLTETGFRKLFLIGLERTCACNCISRKMIPEEVDTTVVHGSVVYRKAQEKTSMDEECLCDKYW